MKKQTVEKCFSTCGFVAVVPGQIKQKLVRIAHDKLKNGSWNFYVVSAHNLNQYNNLGTITLTSEQATTLFDSYCHNDNKEEFRVLAEMFGIYTN